METNEEWEEFEAWFDALAPDQVSDHLIEQDAWIAWQAGRHSVYGKEARDAMLTALQEVLATPGLQSGLQAMCAAAIAKATGRDVADVIKGKRDDSAFEECMARLRNALDAAKGE